MRFSFKDLFYGAFLDEISQKSHFHHKLLFIWSTFFESDSASDPGVVYDELIHFNQKRDDFTIHGGQHSQKGIRHSKRFIMEGKCPSSDVIQEEIAQKMDRSTYFLPDDPEHLENMHSPSQIEILLKKYVPKYNF